MEGEERERRCPACGAGLPADRVGERCPACARAPGGPPPIPFDAPRLAGFFPALWQTWRDSLFSPNTFFRRIPSAETAAWPLTYAALFTLVGMLAFVAQQPLLRGILAVLPLPVRLRGEFLQLTPEAEVLLVVLSPLLGLSLAVAAAAVLHGLLALVTGARPEFRVTLRAVCYAFGTLVLLLVPLAGPALNLVAWLALWSIGLARAHAAALWQGAFAVLLPAVAGCGLTIALWLFVVAALLRGTPR
ncbi:MAG: YIP1 family protein [Armatimonadetes bacterium]|nr:YIP1 family protein [Armatimonadota bacterium]